jgi:hypothetical protein
MELSQVRLKIPWRRNRKHFNGLMARKQGAAGVLADRHDGGPSRDPAAGNIGWYQPHQHCCLTSQAHLKGIWRTNRGSLKVLERGNVHADSKGEARSASPFERKNP